MTGDADRTVAADPPFDLDGVFRRLGDRGLRYALIRQGTPGWGGPDKDIDVLVAKEDADRARETLAELGFAPVVKRPRGTGTFLRRITARGLVTVHLQSSAYYGRVQVVHLDGLSDLVLESATIRDGVRYAPPEFDRYLVIGKLKYEEAPLSPRYAALLGDRGSEDRAVLVREFDGFLRDHGITERRQQGGASEWARRWGRIGGRLARSLLANQHICVLGLDGTGKSTLVEGIHRALARKPGRQYMGEKSWETRAAAWALTDRGSRRGPWTRLLAPLILYGEMWYRYLHASARAGVVVFDRYPAELFLRRKGPRRLIYRLLFNTLFPQPRHRFYLTCSIGTCASRKEDLREPEIEARLAVRKRQFDHYFSRRSGVVVIDTELVDREEALRAVLAALPPEVAARL
jgi:thymidylate kinase